METHLSNAERARYDQLIKGGVSYKEALTVAKMLGDDKAAQESLGIYVPAGWGSFWKPKRDAAKSAKATIAIIGDSVGRGYWASNLETTSWSAKLRTALQAAYGDGGSGWKGSSDSVTQNSLNSVYAGAGLVAMTGTWIVGTASGPGGWMINSQVNSSTLTFTVRGSTVKIYYPTAAFVTPFVVTIDGVAKGTVTPATSTGVAVSSYAVAAGTHTVVITVPASGTVSVFIAGVSGENPAGVVVNNFSVFATASALWNGSDTYGPAIDWSGGPSYPADLLIWEPALNDAAVGNVAADTYLKNFRKALERVRNSGAATGATDLLVMFPHGGKADLTNYLLQDYAARLRAACDTYGAAMVNFWALGRNSWNYWNGLGYWGNAANPAIAGTDTQHLSNAGNQFVADTLLPILTG